MTLGLNAVASPGYTFTGWTGHCSGTNPSLYVSLGGPRTCGATFTPPVTYTLAISPTPTGGTVSGSGLTCGTGGATCSVSLAGGTTATLTATPATGYTFASWGGDCSGSSATTTVTMSAARSCSATFSAVPTYALAISPTPTGRAL